MTFSENWKLDKLQIPKNAVNQNLIDANSQREHEMHRQHYIMEKMQAECWNLLKSSIRLNSYAPTPFKA